MSLKGYPNFMQENIFKIIFANYWRNIDKKIFFCFIIYFFLGLFFSFSSTSSLAGERLNKNYFFFFKTFNIYFFSTFNYDFLSIIETPLLKKIVIPLFVISFIFLALVPIIGVEVKGAKRWLDFYIFRLQPIELLNLFLFW